MQIDAKTLNQTQEEAIVDLGPLAWVFEELCKSFDSANKALERFDAESKAKANSDLAAIDTTHLRLAKQHLHQVVGVVEVLGVREVVLLVGAMESSLQRFVQKPNLWRSDAIEKLERASFAVIEYFECVLAGKATSSLALFAEYRDVVLLAGSDRFHPADLWSRTSFEWLNPAMPLSQNAIDYSGVARARFEIELLKLLQKSDSQAAGELSQLSLGLADTQTNDKARIFWKLCAGFFEAISENLLSLNGYVKRAASGILIHYNSMSHGEWIFSEKFMLNLLFFCEQASLTSRVNSASTQKANGKNRNRIPLLSSIKKTWQLKEDSAVDYEVSRYGHFDPAVLSQARKRIVVAKELWTALAAGDMQKIRATVEQFNMLAESLLKLYPMSEPLVHTLMKAIDGIALEKTPPKTELALEVATAMLYIEAVFEEWGTTEAEMSLRSKGLADRLEQVLNGGKAKTVEPWIEELFRRVGDRESMGGVVTELRICLTDIEKSVDQYFRSPTDHAALHAVPGQLNQMRGIFSILGLDQASQAVAAMRSTAEDFTLPKFDFGKARAKGLIDKFGNNLGTLGFLIDMLNYQPALVKKLFVFDDKTGELNPLMGREHIVVSKATDYLADDAEKSKAKAEKEKERDEDKKQHTTKKEKVLQTNILSASTPLETEFAVAVVSDSNKALVESKQLQQQLEDDLELKLIFFDEATEVIESGARMTEVLSKEPHNPEAQTTLRRAFHTLKGSARMVGFNNFGEAAWSFDQLINTKLADQVPFDKKLLTLSRAALDSLSEWLKDLKENRQNQKPWDASIFRRAADAMRIGNTLDVDGLLVRTDLSVEGKAKVVLPIVEVPVMIPLEIDVKVEPKVEIHEEPNTVQKVAVNGLSTAQAELAHEPEIKTGDMNVSPPALLTVPASDPTTQEIIEAKHEEQYKVIGDLKIGIPLYNVYLNEADEWVRRLITELDEWAIERHNPLQDTTAGLAHALSGASATVGFSGLARLSKSLEKALERSQKRGSSSVEQISLFKQASDECHRLLHQFAAGFLKVPDPKILKLLDSINFEVESVEASNANHLGKSSKEVQTHSVALTSKVDTQVLKVQDVKEDAVDLKPVMVPIVGEAVDPKLAVLARSTVGSRDDEDDIDAKDALDVDLYDIYEEEARELLPRLGGALRQWLKRPDNLSARAEVLRTLHTLKGSSRLAGAMRMGELTHRMESVIDSIGVENLVASQIEPLLIRLDVLQQTFDALQAPAVAATLAAGSTNTHAHTTNSSLDDNSNVIASSQPVEASSRTVLEAVQENKSEAPVNQQVFEVEKVQTTEKPIHTQSEKSEISVKASIAPAAVSVVGKLNPESRQSVRIRARLLDRLVNQAGEVILSRTRIESELGNLRGSLGDLTGNLDKLRQQLRDIELQSETQMQSRMGHGKDSEKTFDPLEFDRFTRVQELTRMMAESVNDVATVQRSLQRTVELTEDDLVAQARQTRDLQRDLLRTRMEEFESISDRLYRVVRQAAKDTGKQVRLDIVAGSIELDRGVLERMTPAFEHLLRNCVAHGIEPAEIRSKSGKDTTGAIAIALEQDGNDVTIRFSDDGAGLNYARIREKAIAQKMISADSHLSDAETLKLIFTPGLSTATEITELAGRGIGLDIVQSEILSLGGRIDVSSEAGKGTTFNLVLPLTTAVTNVVMMRCGQLTFGVPAHLVEVVRRATDADMQTAYKQGFWGKKEDNLPFYWSGALLQAAQQSEAFSLKNNSVIVFRSAGQRMVLHVDEVFGNKEVVVKNLGPQLAGLPGLAGMAILVSGAVALIYNPVVLAKVYGSETQNSVNKKAKSLDLSATDKHASQQDASEQHQAPLILVVDDSITVRRVTQRFLQREGFRVVLAVDGLQAIEKLAGELPAVVLSDIEMPRMDGFDLLRNIRADERLMHLPVVMITSRIAEKHREHAMALGANDYLGKPYSEEGLLTILRGFIAQNTAQAAAAG